MMLKKSQTLLIHIQITIMVKEKCLLKRIYHSQFPKPKTNRPDSTVYEDGIIDKENQSGLKPTIVFLSDIPTFNKRGDGHIQCDPTTPNKLFRHFHTSWGAKFWYARLS